MEDATKLNQMCAIFHATEIQCGTNSFILELAVIGSARWDQAESCIYDLSDVVTPDVHPEDMYGLKLNSQGSSYWCNVYEDMRAHYSYYKSAAKPVVGIVGSELLKKLFKGFGVETVDLQEKCGLPQYDCLLKDRYDCGHHTPSESGCAATRVITFRNWLCKNAT